MELPKFKNPLVSDSEGESSEELQRTDEWHAQRLGMFTGSRMADLMTCKSRAKGKNWQEHKWLFDFGDTALTYISERAIERATGERIQTPTTWQMQWGTAHEDEAKEYFENETGLRIKEVGFTKFLINAGASPDGIYSKNGKDFVFEVKCPATLQSHRKLMNEQIAEGHTYFWQLQAEMLAMGLHRTGFFTYDPRYPEGAKLAGHEVNISYIHIFAMMFRLAVAEKMVNTIIALNFKCDDRAILQEIADSAPKDWEELEKWGQEQIDFLKTNK